MKKLFFFLLLSFFALPLFALRSGQDTIELENIKWLRGNPQHLVFRNSQRNLREYRIAVFMLTNTGNAVDTLRMLNSLAERYAKFIKICVITPDPETDAVNLLSQLHTPHLSFGIDTARKTTQRYMAGSMLFPMAFVADGTRTIVWNGECIDLPELLAEAEKNPINTDKYEKLSPLLDELQALLRSSDSRRIRLFADRIFKLDPGNAAALRMGLFVLENTGKAAEGWNIIREQLTAVPRKARLYYTALDYLSRHPVFTSELPEITGLFLANIHDADACDYLTWHLLSRFNFDSGALTAAVKIYEKGRSETQKTRRSPAALAGHTAAGALLAAKLGNFTKAIELQHQTIRHWEAAKNPAAAENAKKIAEYLILCSKTRVKW